MQKVDTTYANVIGAIEYDDNDLSTYYEAVAAACNTREKLIALYIAAYNNDDWPVQEMLDNNYGLDETFIDTCWEEQSKAATN